MDDSHGSSIFSNALGFTHGSLKFSSRMQKVRHNAGQALSLEAAVELVLNFTSPAKGRGLEWFVCEGDQTTGSSPPFQGLGVVG
jgi:hypothetical protein